MTRRRLLVLAAGILLVGILVARNAGPPAPSVAPGGAFAFAVLGDQPYYPWEELQYRLVLQDLAAHDLAFVVHLGDLFWKPCSEERYRKSLDQLNALPHPVVYTPGDNEWTDCWGPQEGGYEPLERLEALRRVFFADPRVSLGGTPIPLATQADAGEFGEFVENARWERDGLVFATVHVPGSGNGREPRPGATEAHAAAADRREAAAVAWIAATFAHATEVGADAVVLAWHAHIAFEDPTDDHFAYYRRHVDALVEACRGFAGPVLLLVGDDHVFQYDQPLRDAEGRPVENLTRLMVPGSPRAGWVRVEVAPGTPPRFRVEPRIVPTWKYF